MAARLAWTPDQWDGLTATQRVFLMRALEQRDAEVAEAWRDGAANALVNGLRKRGAPVVPLYEDLSRKPAMSRREALAKMAAMEAMG
nr:hypothetical protein [uncultured Olsenella sp.]